MIQVISMVRETSNDWREHKTEKQQNVICMCELCKRSAFLFIFIEAELYLSDIAISLKIETFCCLG